MEEIFARADAGEDIAAVAKEYGYNGMEDSLSVGVYDRDENAVRALTLAAGESMTFLSDEHTLCGIYCLDAQDAELTVEDVNFDGTGDLSVLAWNTTGANLPRYYWLWNEENQRFEYAFCLSNLEVDAENRQLVTSTRENAVTYVTEYYEYAADGSIRLTRRVTDEYFPAE